MKKALLFDNFYYGMPRNEIEKKLQISNLNENKEKLLKSPNPVSYLDMEWEEIFYLNNENLLREIILSRIGQEEKNYLSVQKALVKNGWLPVAAEIEEATFDLFEQGESRLEDETSLIAFENKALNNGKDLAIYFFPTAFAQNALHNCKIKFWANAIDKAPDNFCLLSLMQDADNLKLSFTAPLLSRRDALKYGQMIRR